MDRKDFKFDLLKMYFREDYVTKLGITIRQPTIGKILQLGESKVYGELSPFVYTPTQFRLQLWDMGIDWNKLTEFNLFRYLVQGMSDDSASFCFPDFSFKGFVPMEMKPPKSEETEDNEDENTEEPKPIPILYNPEKQMIIKEEDYLEMSEYLREMFLISPKTEKAKGRATKEAIIWEDRENAMKMANQPQRSNLLPLISACVNHPGFKYKLQELREVGIYEFMDSVQRLQVYENTRAMLTGSMSGFADMSKVPKEQFNFMRDMHDTGDKKRPVNAEKTK